MEDRATYSTREETTPSLDTPQPPSPSPVPDVGTDDPSTRSLGTENIDNHPTDTIGLEYTTVGLTPSSDIEIPSSPSATPVLDEFLPIGMPLPLDSSAVLSEHTSFSLV